MITSVARGRCGPCASTAPTGRMATAFVRSRSRTSSQVKCAKSRTAMSGCMVRGGAVDRQPSVADICHMPFQPPEQFNIADYFLDARVREGKGARPAVLTDAGALTYQTIQALANQFGHVLTEAGVQPEQRVMIALPDGPAFVAVLFGTLKIGAVVVMVNPELKPEAIDYFYRYTRAQVVVAHPDSVDAFRTAARGARHLKTILVVGEPALDERLARAPAALDTFPSHRDDAAIWLFSGGTTGQPKAVVQTHTSFANTAECYAKGVIGYTERDITLSVPKLYFGYATGSNLLFPFSVGAATVLFPEAATAEVLFQRIA